MRIVLDSNVVVSGFLWNGPPRALITAAIDERIALFTSAPLLAELERICGRERFATRMALYRLTPRVLVDRYRALTDLVIPALITSTIQSDPDDDAVLACAFAAKAEAIVSGDKHLLNLKQYQSICLLTPAQAVKQLSEED